MPLVKKMAAVGCALTVDNDDDEDGGDCEDEDEEDEGDEDDEDDQNSMHVVIESVDGSKCTSRS